MWIRGQDAPVVVCAGCVVGAGALVGACGRVRERCSTVPVAGPETLGNMGGQPAPSRKAAAVAALNADVADIQGGTTGEGIHRGAMAGTLDLVQRGLTGLETREEALWLDPVPLPAQPPRTEPERCGRRNPGREQ